MATYSSIAAAFPTNKQMALNCRETQSETSSTDSEMSNLHTIAAQLGMNMKELSIEQFKVEREKLEAMLTEECEESGTSNAEKFFNDIMTETSTYIKWPRRLKIGAKTRKDPHVEIIGKYENVKRAKEQVISLLNSRGNRVTMKLNVSYRDHSFIIGKCGKSIKLIMDDTKTHIHFPDSNRFNKHEKSNQVSFTGPLEGVERARARVRKSSPLVLQFELPVIANDQKLPDIDSPLIRDVCTAYDVQVSYSHRSKLHATSVLVKGSEINSANVKVATQRLIAQLCKGVTNPMEVSIQMDISPQYHFIVKGKDNRNLKRIMEHSKTKIIFPDLNDTNFSPLRRCQISITGSIEGVCEARDYIIGNLPVALMFEYPDKNIDLDEIARLNKTLDVFITVRSKSHHGSLCIVVKGIEKYVSDIYEARNKILQLNQPTVTAEIPSSYYFQYENKNNMHVQSLFQMHSNSPGLDFGLDAGTAVTPIMQHNNHNQQQQQQQLHQQQQQQQHQQQQQLNNSQTQSSQQQPQLPLSYSPNENLSQLMNRMFLSPNPHTRQHSPMVNLSPIHPPEYHEQNGGMSFNMATGTSNNSSNLSPRCISTNTSGYHSVSSSTTSLDHLNNFSACLTPIPSGSLLKVNQDQDYYRRQQRMPSVGVTPPTPAQAMAASYHQMHRTGDPNFMYHQSPNFEAKRQFDHSPIFDFDMKKLEGIKAMELPPRADQPRTPTSCWAGIGLSRSSTMLPKSPSTLTGGVGQQQSMAANNNIVSPYHLGKTGGILDSTPVNNRHQLVRHETIQSLLTSLNLDRYISYFVTNEIDLDMFSTLTEDDLQELGITAFGPRKKLLMAINYLSRHHVQQQQRYGGPLGGHDLHPHNMYQLGQTYSISGGRGPVQQQQTMTQQQQQANNNNNNQQHHNSNNNNNNNNSNSPRQNQQTAIKESPPGLQAMPPGNNGNPKVAASTSENGHINSTGNSPNSGTTTILNGATTNGPPPGIPPKFSGSAAPGAERRTSTGS